MEDEKKIVQRIYRKEELDKIAKEIKNYLNQSETILQKKEILQNNQKEI